MGEFITKCLTGTAKQFANVILYSYKNMQKSYCNMKNKKKVDTLILMARCMNPIMKKGEVCVNKYINALHGGKRALPANNRIGYACW